MKRFIKILYFIFVFYFIYFISTVMILPNYYPKYNDNNCQYYDNDYFYDNNNSNPDKITLIENNKALSARINLIENAKETIEVTQFYINTDKVGYIFLGELLKAADRGVKVKIIIDGKYNKVSGLNKDYLYALIIHPNIKIKLFEPFKIFKPWTINNVLHDKLLIIDNKYAMISGRNIGERYFFDDVNNFVYDLDTIITYIGNTEIDYNYSVIKQMKGYFTYIWNHKYSVNTKDLNKAEKIKGVTCYKQLLNKLESYQKSDIELFSTSFDWEKISVETNKITLIYNPLQRFNKKPKVWCTIANLINNAEKEVFVNSPYIVPTEEIANKIDFQKIDDLEVNILTNSAGSTPNYFAFSGYLRYKKNILSYDNINIYEYQGRGSLHSKTYIIDNRISIVGSLNLDPRSIFLSTESMIVVDSEEFTEILKNYYEKQINKSLLTNGLYSYEEENIEPLSVPLGKKILLSIMRYISIFIDHLV